MMQMKGKKTKRAKPSQIKPVYEYDDREFIIKNGFGWTKHKKFSSKKAAHEGIMTMQRLFGKSNVGNMTSVRTSRGWTVFQLSKKGFRTKASEIKKHGKKKY